jgi:hypothetical protein
MAWPLPALGCAAAATSRPPATAVSAVTKDSWTPQIRWADLRSIARDYSLLITDAGSYFNPKIRYLHSLNPGLTALPYVNALVKYSKDGDYPRLLASDPGWFLRDREGRLVHEPGRPQNVLMDPASPGWIAYRAHQLRKLVDQFGYDGAFLDNVFAYISDHGSVYYSAQPIDPRTGAQYGNQSWYQDTLRFLRAMKRAIGPSKLLIFNGLVTGRTFVRYRYQDLSYVAATDGALEEGFVRWDTDPAGAHRSEAAWKQDVDSIAAINRTGKIAIGWTDLARPATAAQANRIELYSLSSYLLAAGGARYYSFLNEPVTTPVQPYDPTWSLKLGAPLGPYYYQRHLYQRDFTGGKVVVNPTDTGNAYTLELHHPYATPDGHLTSAITVPPKTGRILLRALSRRHSG